MGRNSNGVRGGGSARTQTAEKYNNDLGVTVQSIKGALLNYASIDRWNRSNVYHLGFNDQATDLVEDLAKGDYGLATTIAKQAVDSPYWGQYGSKFSEKQAYVLARAAYDNKLIREKDIIFKDNSKEAAELDARQRAARSARRQRRKEREERIKAVAESNKGYKVGSIIKEPRTGREGKVVSMTSEIVEVDYGGGIKRKYSRKYARFL